MIVNVYCSATCHRRDANSRRRRSMRTAKVGEVRRWWIYERDGYTCRLCGKKTLPSKQATLGTSDPHPLAPVLDHIVPLSLGGAHAEHNLQCAHFICNAMKSDGVWGPGEQLRLIA